MYEIFRLSQAKCFKFWLDTTFRSTEIEVWILSMISPKLEKFDKICPKSYNHDFNRNLKSSKKLMSIFPFNWSLIGLQSWWSTSARSIFMDLKLNHPPRLKHRILWDLRTRVTFNVALKLRKPRLLTILSSFCNLKDR